METVSLRKALKLKKTWTGEFARLTATITRLNSQRTPNKHVDVQALIQQRFELQQRLIKLKTAIAKANIDVYVHIISVDELKAEIAFLNSLDVEEEGREWRPGNPGSEVVFTKTVALNYADREALVKKAQAELEAHLEKIDTYNSNVGITVPE